MDFNKIRELLKSLVNDSTSTEDIERIGAINNELESAENEVNDLVNKHEDLRKKYIDAIKDTSFAGKPKEEESKPKTLEECIQEAQRKDK